MEHIVKIFENHAVQTIFILICSYILYLIVKKAITAIIERTNLKDTRKGKKLTYVRLFKNALKYTFIIATFLILLQINGVDVRSMVAGIGIVGIISGLAFQDVLKDIIMGASILADNYFAVGDVVKYNDITGKVIGIGLKTTKIQDIYTNDMVSISNRNIDKIVNVSKWLDLDIPISYNEKIEKIENVLNEVKVKISEMKKIEKCDYLGVNEFDDSCIRYKMRIYCLPENKPQIKRDALREIKIALDKNNIKIPYQQIDIHTY